MARIVPGTRSQTQIHACFLQRCALEQKYHYFYDNFINNAHLMEKLLFRHVIANQESSLAWLVMARYGDGAAA